MFEKKKNKSILKKMCTTQMCYFALFSATIMTMINKFALFSLLCLYTKVIFCVVYDNDAAASAYFDRVFTIDDKKKKTCEKKKSLQGRLKMLIKIKFYFHYKLNLIDAQ